MSTLTRTNSNGRRPQYKDYVSFLESYRSPGLNSVTSSLSNSSSSLCSDQNEPQRNGVSAQKPTVKTEMFIQIKDPSEGNESRTKVSSTAKLFETSEKVSAVGGITKKFELPAHRTVKKANSISEVSKTFQQRNFNSIPKPFQVPNKASVVTNGGDPAGKPAITSPKPTAPPPAVLVSPPPPPPPLPPATLPQKPLTNGISKSPSQDSADGRNTIDKNDPRVKKMVYGALRNMYGAYHDKANDYLATLPKNRVRKNNGLDSIIDSIASQGGLEKLTGRTNPNVENE